MLVEQLPCSNTVLHGKNLIVLHIEGQVLAVDKCSFPEAEDVTRYW